MKVTIIPIVTRALGTRTGGLGDNVTGGNSLNYIIIGIGKNIEKSPGIEKESKTWPYSQIVYAQSLKLETKKTLWDFEIQYESLCL